MDNIDIFNSAKPQDGEFFKFKNVGDQVQGTYVDKREATDTFGNQQTIYVLQTPEGKIWNLGFRQTSVIVHERMNGIRFGQIVGFRFDEERDSKKQPGVKAKIIRIYADPKLVDAAWLEQRAKIEANYQTSNTTASEAIDEEDEDLPFKSPVDVAQDEENLPTTDAEPKNEAIDAIRNLALTKGLTNDQMKDEEADKTIEAFTSLSLTEENYTKVIIALTGFVKK